jgi:Mg2+ and Co2+ transporter CorA
MTEAQQPLPGIPWFNIPDPNSPALDEVAKRFHLHELQIEDCLHRPQRVKTDEYGKYVFSMLKHVWRTGNEESQKFFHRAELTIRANFKALRSSQAASANLIGFARPGAPFNIWLERPGARRSAPARAKK